MIVTEEEIVVNFDHEFVSQYGAIEPIWHVWKLEDGTNPMICGEKILKRQFNWHIGAGDQLCDVCAAALVAEKLS